MATTTDNIIQRIKALMRHADSAKETGSLAEAETFTNKVNELLLQYNLEMAEVQATADVQTDEFKNWMYSERIGYKDNQSGQRWRLELIGVLCTHNFCNYTFNSGRKDFTVYGHMQNVDTVVWLYNFLNVGLLRLAQEKHVALPKEMKKLYNRYAYLKDFLLGAVEGINQKLEKQRVEVAKASNLTGLMIYNKEALQKFVRKDNPDIKTVGFKPIEVGFGYKAGVKAGFEYSINAPLKSTAPAKTITASPKRLN